MKALLRITALAFLALLGLVQSGLPAFVGEVWARTSMYCEYEKVMAPGDALKLVLDGDLGCGYFTELEALNERAGALTLAWVAAQPPLLLPRGAERADIPYPDFSDIRYVYGTVRPIDCSHPVDTPPPRAI